jgi:hypothetical protein
MSAIPIQTSTLVPSQTETVPPATWTPLPTLSPGIAAAQLMKWFQGTPGCLFPCMGGIVPGMTTWAEAKGIMQPFTGIMGIGEDNPYKGIGGYITSDPKLSILMSADSTSIVKINVEGYPPSPVLRVDQILAQYGPPEKVFVSAWPVTDFPLILTLAYPNYQFVIQYTWTMTMNIKDITSCIQEGYVHLLILSNTGPWSDDYIKRQVFSPGNFESPFQALDQATNITIQDFYEKFKNIDGSECVVTPIRNWLPK